jgi:hypothetical protein
MCDIEIPSADSSSVRLDIKTWSAAFWPDLGRCVAVDQLRVLERKADSILWCILRENTRVPKEVWLARPSVRVSLVGYSTFADIRQAPIKLTGRTGMRQVQNHQLAEKDIRSLDELMSLLSSDHSAFAANEFAV